jgi:hypothetical protein
VTRGNGTVYELRAVVLLDEANMSQPKRPYHARRRFLRVGAVAVTRQQFPMILQTLCVIIDVDGIKGRIDYRSRA